MNTFSPDRLSLKLPRPVSGIALPVGIAAACVTFAASACHADVKVVARATVDGVPGKAGRGPQTQTTYYKGAKTRTEIPSGGVSIYDAQAKTLTLINTAQKTYSVTPLAAAGQNPMMAMMDIKTVAAMKPGGKTKTIAGKPAKNYLWNATITLGFKQGAMPPMRGQNGGAAPPKMPTGPLFTMKMDGEQWTTEAVKLPGVNGQSLAASIMSGPANALPGLQPLFSKLAAMKGLPLSSTIHQSFVRSAAMAGIPTGAGASVPDKTITSTIEVTSITDAPLSDALFAPPAGYRKVENKMPSRPGAGMGM